MTKNPPSPQHTPTDQSSEAQDLWQNLQKRKKASVTLKNIILVAALLAAFAILAIGVIIVLM